MPATAADAAEPAEKPPPAPEPPPLPPDRELPEYGFLEEDDERAEGRFGWRWMRAGRALRPTRSEVAKYTKIFVARLGAPDQLYAKGDRGIARLLLRYADAVHARIAWYERALRNINRFFQLWRLLLFFLPVALLALVVVVILLNPESTATEYIVVMATVLGVWLQLGLKVRNDKGHIDAYILALSALKKQLYAFEALWDDRCWQASRWPDGFASALSAGIRVADAIEEAERIATLRAAADAAGSGLEALGELVGKLPRVASAQAALVTPAEGTLTALQDAEIEAEAARQAEAAALAAGFTKPEAVEEYQKARIAAEAKVLRLRKEEELLRAGGGG